MRKRNKFSLSHYKLLSCKMGQLVPIGLTEVLPGDTIQQSTSVFIRFSPMVAPVMHPVHVKIHHWYVPFRLVWDDFENFITGGSDGLDDSVPPFSSRDTNNTPGAVIPSYVGSLSDHLGVPPFWSGTADTRYSTLPHRAYQLIWNEWYRDQNLQEEMFIPKTSGRDVAAVFPGLNKLQYSAWNKDYFTTATPWEQKGIAVQVPVNGDANIIADGNFRFSDNGSFAGNGKPYGTVLAGSSSNLFISGSGVTSNEYEGQAYAGGLKFDENNGLSIDLNQLREAFALQRFEEHRALYGSRYVEYLRYLGIKASDARLQRPEYLGGGRSTIQFSEVLQTAEGTDPVGTMRGHGIGAIRTNRYRRFIEEHGLILTLMTIRPISVYTQGLPRMFSRRTKEDYWQKELEHIGQQEVKNSELYFMSESPDSTFGFTDRYDEYRSSQSSVAGEFRTTLNYWHFGREFADEPVLNGDFISSAPTNRPFADQTGNDTLYVMANHSIQARRIVSRKGTPI